MSLYDGDRNGLSPGYFMPVYSIREDKLIHPCCSEGLTMSYGSNDCWHIFRG